MGTKRVGLARTQALIENLKRELQMNGTQLVGGKRKVDNATLNTGAAVTTTLGRTQSGTLFTIDGTDDIVVNMPALSTSNVGVTYDFIVTTAVASGKTVTFVLPGSAVSNWYTEIFLYAGASYPTSDVAGDTLTLIATTAANARVSLTCVTDDGTNSTWQASVTADQIATVT
jgi:hypothetical protein